MHKTGSIFVAAQSVLLGEEIQQKMYGVGSVGQDTAPKADNVTFYNGWKGFVKATSKEEAIKLVMKKNKLPSSWAAYLNAFELNSSQISDIRKKHERDLQYVMMIKDALKTLK